MRLPLRFAAVLLALALPLAPAGAQDAMTIEAVPTYSAGMGAMSGPFTLLSLRDGAIVVAPDDAVRTDSSSAAWDIGLRGTEVILNGGASGPGAVIGALVEAPFESVTALPDALSADGNGDCPRGAARVVCHGSGNGWYVYAENGVMPLPGRTLVIRRADGSALKVRFADYVVGETVDGNRQRFVTLDVAPLD